VRKRRLSGGKLDEVSAPRLTSLPTIFWTKQQRPVGEELERSNKARHLFNASALEAAKPEQKFGRHTQAELGKMPPQQVLS
jgi:hypothetical protein